MSLLIYILKLLSKFSFRWLYLISDVLAFILNKVIGYRKEVIKQNLQNSFPEKADIEIEGLTRDYYLYMADLMVETIKLHSMSSSDISDRVAFKNPEILENKRDRNKNVIIMMGHSGNWEWASHATQLYFNFRMVPVYRKLKNNEFDRYYFDLRSKFKVLPIRDKEAFTRIQENKELKAVAMLADQTPGSKKGWWMEFFHQKTPFFRGSEVLARRLNYEVVFAHIHRSKKRGYYEILFKDLSDVSNEKGELTKAFANSLEEEIKKDPANWLWSHKRWKHKPSESSVWID